MDDYVSKPFSLRTLKGTLERWIDGTEDTARSDQTSSTVQEREVGETPLIDEAALDQIREVDRLSGDEVLARIVGLFLDEAPEVLATVAEAVRDEDADRLADRAHALKSLCVSVGAASMATVCKQLEATGKKGTTEEATPLVTELKELFAMVKPALESRIEAAQTDEVAPT